MLQEPKNCPYLDLIWKRMFWPFYKQKGARWRLYVRQASSDGHLVVAEFGCIFEGLLGLRLS